MSRLLRSFYGVKTEKDSDNWTLYISAKEHLALDHANYEKNE